MCVLYRILLLVGVGFSQLFELFPNLHFIIKCVGVLYLLYLAYLIASSSSSIHSDHQNQPLSFMKGAIFQWFNAKAWVVATGAIAAFTTAGTSFLAQNMMIATTFFVVSFPCVGLWLAFGSLLKNILNSPKRRKWFNFAMSGLLVLSVYPVLVEITQEIS
ncbi:LysE family translocator [Vibrio nomapromontoriensis]|uniref:LysE family translocator n=1 Tax=Vibrio nomapromontoriensis TaxID=2910246 RepID=UPI003D11B34C